MLTLLMTLACGDSEPEATTTETTPQAEATQPEAQVEPAPAPAQGPQTAEEVKGVPVLDHRPENADQAGAVVMVTGTLDNSTLAQVRLMAIRDGQAEIFDLRAGLEGRFFAEAPANWEEPIYISAVEVDPENPATVATGWGAVAEPIVLSGEDVHVRFAIGDAPGWTEGVTPGLDTIVDAEPLNQQRMAP